MRALLAATIALAVLVAPASGQDPAAVPVETPAPLPASPDFYPSKYLGAGDAFNCSDFVSQADAQAVLRADPTDPNKLDTDKDGIACETRPLPKDLVPVPR